MRFFRSKRLLIIGFGILIPAAALSFRRQQEQQENPVLGLSQRIESDKTDLN